MKKIYTDDEIDQMNKDIAAQTFRKARKFEFILLDPTGIELDRHDFFYTGGYGNRIVLVIDGWYYFAKIDGKHISRIGPEPIPTEVEEKFKYGRGFCNNCGEGYDNEEEWKYNTKCAVCGHPIPENLIIKKPE